MFSWVGKLHFNCKGCWRMNESEGFSTYSSIDQCSHWNTFYLQSVRRKSWKRNRKWKCFRLVTRRSDLWLEYWIGRHWWFTSLFFTRTWQCGVCQCNWWLGFWVSLRFNYLLFKKFIVAVILKYFSRIMFLKVLDFFLWCAAVYKLSEWQGSLFYLHRSFWAHSRVQPSLANSIFLTCCPWIDCSRWSQKLQPGRSWFRVQRLVWRCVSTARVLVTGHEVEAFLHPEIVIRGIRQWWHREFLSTAEPLKKIISRIFKSESDCKSGAMCSLLSNTNGSCPFRGKRK